MVRSIGAVILGSLIILIGAGLGGANAPFLGVDFLIVFLVSGIAGAYVTSAIAKRAEYKHALALIVIIVVILPANPRSLPLAGQPLWPRFLFALIAMASVVVGTGLRAWLKNEESAGATAPDVAPRKGFHPLSLSLAIACLLIGVALIVIPFAAARGEAALTGVSAWNVDIGAGAIAVLAGLVIASISAIALIVLLSEWPSKKALVLGIIVLIIGGYGVIRTAHWGYNSGQAHARKH